MKRRSNREENMTTREKISQYLDDHLEDMLEDTMRLIRIDSAKSEARPGAPYGEGPARVLELAADMMNRYGFDVGKVADVVITGKYNDRPTHLDILAHLDVVPGGQDWTVCSPFEPRIVEGKLYGRGAADDKGPAMAAMYAMRAVKDSGVTITRNVRLVLGSDEECGSSDIKIFYAEEPEAPMTFSPDADWPLVNIEKGLLNASFSAIWENGEALPRILSIKGGEKANVVPGRAEAMVQGISEETVRICSEQIGESTGVAFRWEVGEKEADILRIFAKGVSCHASAPHNGSNALTGMIQLLCALPFAQSSSFEAVKGLEALFPHGITDGSSIGMKVEDEVSGRLTLAFSILRMRAEGLEGLVDSRVPVSGQEAVLKQAFINHLHDRHLHMEEWKYNPPHHVPEESPFVQALLAAYTACTGKDARAMAIGVGTYVHNLKNGVAFGCATKDVDNRMHGPDEFMDISQLRLSAGIFAEAILRLCCDDCAGQ